MARSFKNPGETVSFTADQDYASGDFVSFGSLRGIVQVAVATGNSGEMHTCGMHDVAKVAAEVWTVGQPVWLNGAGDALTNVDPGGGVERWGVTTLARAAGDARGRVILRF